MFQNRELKKWFPLLLVIVMAMCIAYSLSGIITVLLGALLFYVLTRPLMSFLVEKWHLNKIISALLIILLSFVLIMGPLILVSNVLYLKLVAVSQDPQLQENLQKANSGLKELLGTDIFVKENILALQKEITNFMAIVVEQTFAALGSIAIMYFVLYYMLINYGKMESGLKSILPLSADSLRMMSHELNKQVYSNAVAAPLLAFIQGLLASACYYFFQVHDPIFWGMISGIFSFIPFVGSALIWAPIGIMALLNGDLFAGWAVLITGIAIISSADNILRFMFQKKIADIHPLITLFGLIGGVKLFGITGVIFGPLLLSYFLILFKLFREEWADRSA